MPLTPDAPFPKTRGHTIRSKDWNDLVDEVIRLDDAKVNRAGDAMTGSLTVASRIGVGTTSPDAALHLGGGQWNPSTTEGDLKIGTATHRLKIGVATGGGGAGDVRIRSHGGTSRIMLGSGTADVLTVSGSNVGIGTIEPNRALTIHGTGATYANIRGNNGAQEVLLGAETVGGVLSVMTNHALQLRTANATRMAITNAGNIGIGTTSPTARLHVAGGDLRVGGSVLSSNLRSTIRRFDTRSISSLTNTVAWNAIPDMNTSVTSPGAWFLLLFTMSGVQATGVTQAHAEFRLLVGGGQQDYGMYEFHNNEGWELRTVTLSRLIFLSAGTHAIEVQWSIRSPQARPAIPPFIPEVRVTLTGCWNSGDNRDLVAIQL